mgnify:CR=1 FL=1
MTRKPAEDRKAEIIAALLALADSIGPDRVTTGAVAVAVGVTQAALFRHFPSKSALWLAAAEDLAARMEVAWSAALASGDTPVARLEALTAAQFGQIAATPALPMLLFSRELCVDNPELRVVFRCRLTEFLALLAHEVRAAQQSGTLTEAIAAEDGAALIAATVQGVAIRGALGAREFDLRTEGARMVTVQLRLLTTSA